MDHPLPDYAYCRLAHVTADLDSGFVTEYAEDFYNAHLNREIQGRSPRGRATSSG